MPVWHLIVLPNQMLHTEYALHICQGLHWKGNRANLECLYVTFVKYEKQINKKNCACIIRRYLIKFLRLKPMVYQQFVTSEVYLEMLPWTYFGRFP